MPGVVVVPGPLFVEGATTLLPSRVAVLSLPPVLLSKDGSAAGSSSCPRIEPTEPVGPACALALLAPGGMRRVFTIGTKLFLQSPAGVALHVVLAGCRGVSHHLWASCSMCFVFGMSRVCLCVILPALASCIRMCFHPVVAAMPLLPAAGAESFTVYLLVNQ